MTQPVPDPGKRPPRIPVTVPGPGGAVQAGYNAITQAPAAVRDAAFGGLDDAAAAVRGWISNRHNWTRVLWFVGGVICTTVGVAMLGKPAADAAVSAVPIKKVVS